MLFFSLVLLELDCPWVSIGSDASRPGTSERAAEWCDCLLSKIYKNGMDKCSQAEGPSCEESFSAMS
jgi:hypothetical protein